MDVSCLLPTASVNILRSGQNDSLFAYDIVNNIFFNENFWHQYNFIKMGSLDCNSQKVNIGSNDNLVPNRRQAMLWTNVDQDVWGNIPLIYQPDIIHHSALRYGEDPFDLKLRHRITLVPI